MPELRKAASLDASSCIGSFATNAADDAGCIARLDSANAAIRRRHICARRGCAKSALTARTGPQTPMAPASNRAATVASASLRLHAASNAVDCATRSASSFGHGIASAVKTAFARVSGDERCCKQRHAASATWGHRSCAKHSKHSKHAVVQAGRVCAQCRSSSSAACTDAVRTLLRGCMRSMPNNGGSIRPRCDAVACSQEAERSTRMRSGTDACTDAGADGDASASVARSRASSSRPQMAASKRGASAMPGG